MPTGLLLYAAPPPAVKKFPFAGGFPCIFCSVFKPNISKKISRHPNVLFRKRDLTILEAQQQRFSVWTWSRRRTKQHEDMQPQPPQAQFSEHAKLYYGNAAATTAQDATASVPRKPVAVRLAASQQTLSPIHLQTALQAQAPAPHNVVFLPPAMMGQLVCAWQLTCF
jgi:hypothetical protein